MMGDGDVVVIGNEIGTTAYDRGVGEREARMR
jgi:hypothetical protein